MYNDRPCIVGYYCTESLKEGVDKGSEIHYELPMSNESFYFAYEVETYHYEAIVPDTTSNNRFVKDKSNESGILILARKG